MRIPARILRPRRFLEIWKDWKALTISVRISVASIMFMQRKKTLNLGCFHDNSLEIRGVFETFTPSTLYQFQKQSVLSETSFNGLTAREKTHVTLSVRVVADEYVKCRRASALISPDSQSQGLLLRVSPAE